MSFGYGKTKSIGTDTGYNRTAVKSIKKNGKVPALTAEELERVLEEHPEVKDIFIDATERPLERATGHEDQNKDYSGKKKMHSMKNLVFTDDLGKILGISKTEHGKMHDYTMLKESGMMQSLLGYTLRVDLGFQGIKKQYPNHDIQIPHKKRKGKELTKEQEYENTIIGGIRVIVENIIGRAKKYRIIAEKYRSRIRGNFKTVKNNRKESVMLVVCGLHNYWKSQKTTTA